MNRRLFPVLTAALGLGLCLSGAARAADNPFLRMDQAEAERMIDMSLDGDSGSSLTGIIRAQLPADYPGLRMRMAATFRADLDAEAGYWKTRDELNRLYFAHRKDVASAPTATVQALARAEAAYVRVLQANGPGSCASYMLGGPMLLGAPSGDEAANDALESVDLARIAVMSAGVGNPQRREAASDNDFIAFAMALGQHEGERQAVRYLDGAWLKKASQRDLCSALVAYYDAFLALPTESGARIFLSYYDLWRGMAPVPESAAQASTDAEARKVIETWAIKGADEADLIGPLRTALPKDYDTLVDKLSPMVLAGFDRDAIMRQRDSFLIELPLAHLDDLKAAPDAALLDWAKAKAAYHHASQADGVNACVSNVSGVRLADDKAVFSRRSANAFYDAVVAGWRVARAGIDNPTVRPEVTEADRDAWEASIKKRLGDRRGAEVRSAAWRRSAPYKALCAADVASFDAVFDLPPQTAAGLLALAAAGIGNDPTKPYLGLSQANAEKALDAAVDAVPREDFVKALKANLPDDYRTYLRSLADTVRKGGSERQVAEVSDTVINDVLARRRGDFNAAPPELAADFFAKQAASLRSLQREDAARCASVFFTVPHVEKPLSERTQQMIDDAAAARFKAMRAGMDHPVSRGDASDAEMDRWSEAFVDLIPAKAYELYLADEQMTNASDEDRCGVSIAFYGALASFPAETAIRMFKALDSDEDEDAAPTVAALPAPADPAAG